MSTILLLPEYGVTRAQHQGIARLRAEAFPGFAEDRSYYKQLPHHRILALDDRETVIGHLGLDLRVMGVEGMPVRILGIIDLCVDARRRREGIGERMLRSALQMAVSAEIPFLFLNADDDRIYRRVGFVPLDADFTWLRLHEHRSYDQITERAEGMMILPTGEEEWPAGPVDMLGYRF